MKSLSHLTWVLPISSWRQNTTRFYGILSNRVVEIEKSMLKNKLARKHTLLEVARNVDGFNLWTISWVLDTCYHNLSHVVEQWQLIQDPSLSPFVLFERRKRQDGLTTTTKRLVILWWTIETWISLNKKNVTHKHLNPNQYKVHATHFLLESQVS